MQLQQQSMDALFSLTYEELKRLAQTVRRNDPSTTLNATALVHEAWLKLCSSPPEFPVSSLHFKRIAARAMRQLLVEAARRRTAHKRSAGLVEPLANLDAYAEQPLSCEELLTLNSALNELEQLSPHQAELVESRYFGGFEISEIAGSCGVSEETVYRELRTARAWLSVKLRSRTG
jgi:RNA polymerase sigma factor (TIGR02999 family)